MRATPLPAGNCSSAAGEAPPDMAAAQRASSLLAPAASLCWGRGAAEGQP